MIKKLKPMTYSTTYQITPNKKNYQDLKYVEYVMDSTFNWNYQKNRDFQKLKMRIW